MKSFLFAVLVLAAGSAFAATPADIARANAKAQAAARAAAMYGRQARPATPPSARGTTHFSAPRQAPPVRQGTVRPGMRPH